MIWYISSCDLLRCSQIISYLQVLASKCKYGQSATTNRGDPWVVSTESVPTKCGLRTNELWSCKEILHAVQCKTYVDARSFCFNSHICIRRRQTQTPQTYWTTHGVKKRTMSSDRTYTSPVMHECARWYTEKLVRRGLKAFFLIQKSIISREPR